MNVRFIEGNVIYHLYAFERSNMTYKCLYISDNLKLINDKVKELNSLIYSFFMIKSIRKQFYKILNE